MNELFTYDTAAGKFYSEQQLLSSPLQCWDLAGLRFDSLCKSLTDLTAFSNLAKKNKWNKHRNLSSELLDKDYVCVVTNENLEIVLATQNIYEMNGYQADEIIGKSPKIFQGVGTDSDTTNYIRKAILAQKPFEATLLNYKKNGEPYNCWIKGSPVLDNLGKVVNFIAFEREVA